MLPGPAEPPAVRRPPDKKPPRRRRRVLARLSEDGGTFDRRDDNSGAEQSGAERRPSSNLAGIKRGRKRDRTRHSPSDMYLSSCSSSRRSSDFTVLAESMR